MKNIILATTDPSISRREREHYDLARTIAGEGFVLLKNEGMLPLSGKKIALYGSGARRTIAGGTGSGDVHARYYVGIEEGLKNAGFEIATTAWLDRYDKYYDDNYKSWKADIEVKVDGLYDFGKIFDEVSKNPFLYPTGILVEESDIVDTSDAIYVIARQAGEGADRCNVKGDYRLDDLEQKNLEFISSHYKNVMVVINVGGYVDLSFLDKLNINAVMYYSQGGMEGGNAFADIVSGKVSPSGKLSATWPYRLEDFPSTKGYSTNGDPHEQNYIEGIYVGYRYFDTFGVKPRFAFGHGLSYTRFDIKSDVLLDGENLIVIASVTNIGSCSGKEVVQIYATVPEIKEGAEYQRLIGFVKTDELAIGETQTLTVKVSVRDLASFCSDCNKWVLNEGEYLIRVGSASDKTHITAVIVIKEKIDCEKCTAVCVPAKKITELVAPKRKVENTSGIKRIELNKKDVKLIVNKYDEIPVSENPAFSKYLAKLDNRDIATLVLGGDVQGERLVNIMGACGITAMALYEKYAIPNLAFADGPAGLNLAARVVELPDGTFKSADVIPHYDFGMFGKILRQRMIAKPEDGVCHYQYATAWPVGVVCGQTWNIQLIHEMGKAVGKEMEEFGVSVWLAPGMNIVRNTLCGRTFEYYSEDPVLSGEIAAAVVNGVQTCSGKGVSIKHFCCNNCEAERNFSSSNLDQRALREVYLKGFEIAVKKSNPRTVMASYNKVNGIYTTNSYDLLVKVLRNEWGYKGLVMSDWNAITPQSGDLLKAAYAQCDLVMPGHKEEIDALEEAINAGKVDKNNVLRCAERVLKLITENTVVKFKL